MPFVDFLTISNSKKIDISLNAYFYYCNKRLLQSSDLSKTLSTFSNLIISQKLNIQNYRQLIVGFIRYFIHILVDLQNLIIKNKRKIYLNKASGLFIINISYFKSY